jgi:hypothetical protein
MEMPTWLTSEQRKNVHLIAGRLGLSHDSVGANNARRIIISRTNFDEVHRTLPILHNCKSQINRESPSVKKRKEDKIPYGVSEIIPGYVL